MSLNNNYDYCLKICVTGNSQVGKSSLIIRFTDDEFHEDCLPIFGAEFKLRTIQLNNKYIRLNLWDTARSVRFYAIPKIFFKGIHGALFAFDLTDRQSFLDLSKWYDKYLQSNPFNSKPVLIGNKCDLVSERKISYEEAFEFAKSLNMEYLETSAKSKENVEKAFVSLTKKIMEDIDVNQIQNVQKIGHVQGIKYAKKSTCW